MKPTGLIWLSVVCDNQKFNSIVLAYRNNEISLESATKQALSTIIEQPEG